jgi:hypothetical protein
MSSWVKAFVTMYGVLSFLTLLLVGYGMIIGSTPVTFSNLTAPLWMPLVALFVILVVLLPIFVLGIIAKILF